MASTKILFIHGVNTPDNTVAGGSHAWKVEMEVAIMRQTRNLGYAPDLEFAYFEYDDLFEKVPDLSIFPALGLLLDGWLSSARQYRDSARDFVPGDFWTWGIKMVAGLVADDKLRDILHKRLRTQLEQFKPDWILAHSLGSLISYPLLIGMKGLEKVTYLSFGSQIGQPTLSKLMKAPYPIPSVKKWYHLYNIHDPVFACGLAPAGSGAFEEIRLKHDYGLLANHDLLNYFNDPVTVQNFWRPLFRDSWGVSSDPLERSRLPEAASRGLVQSRRPPRTRVLLVGIDEYQDPANNLRGCVNDSYLMSQVLQENRVSASAIRMVANKSATASGIRDALDWLVDGATGDDHLVFHYSGHGAQLPGGTTEPDHLDEVLVPYDFDWTPDKAILDDWLSDFYGGVPYSVGFTMLLDSCHSGGMARGGLSVRGLVPPPDVAHNFRQWDTQVGWSDREFSPRNLNHHAAERYFGKSGTKHRLGRASGLRLTDDQNFKIKDWRSLTLPILFEACQENQVALETVVGNTTHGAFTYEFVQTLRRQRTASSPQQLLQKVNQRLRQGGFQQVSQLDGPTEKLSQPFRL